VQTSEGEIERQIHRRGETEGHPWQSALFLLTDDAVVNEVEGALKDMNAQLIASNLSPEQEAKLREVFAED
jgi:uncharacterized membrane protein